MGNLSTKLWYGMLTVIIVYCCGWITHDTALTAERCDDLAAIKKERAETGNVRGYVFFKGSLR